VVVSRADRLEELRARHPRFVYRSFDVQRRGPWVLFGARFLLEPDLEFESSVAVREGEVGGEPSVARTGPDGCSPEALDALAFHVGLAEIPSYWKAACPPEIHVEAGPLSAEQREWWKGVLANGMGEFVFVNDLDWEVVDSVRIEAEDGPAAGSPHVREGDGVLVPVGGGKDSAVTADLLRRHAPRLGAFTLNPTPASVDVARTAGVDQVLVATREIDPRLLRLNAEGYLNGHTPFSSYLAFLAHACAALYGYGSVAVSNERSSNEGNAVHRGRTVNHQWSKSWDFERRFREYSSAYLPGTVGSFSVLRPAWELQVARMFAPLERYHHVFRSCNRGMATNSWCGRCPKCLFVFALLYPFAGPDCAHEIFGRDLFADTELLGLARELMGVDGHKPLECVGTYEESRSAFHLCVERAHSEPGGIPPLLAAVERDVLGEWPDLDATAAGLLDGWSEEHAVPPDLETALRSEVEASAGRGR
jgi:hypothetical protein